MPSRSCTVLPPGFNFSSTSLKSRHSFPLYQLDRAMSPGLLLQAHWRTTPSILMITMSNERQPFSRLCCIKVAASLWIMRNPNHCRCTLSPRTSLPIPESVRVLMKMLSTRKWRDGPRAWLLNHGHEITTSEVRTQRHLLIKVNLDLQHILLNVMLSEVPVHKC